MRASPVNIGEVRFAVLKKEQQGKDATDRYDVKAINQEGKLEKLILFPYYEPDNREGGIFSTGVAINKKYGPQNKTDIKRKSMPLLINIEKAEEEAFAQMLELINEVVSKELNAQVRSPVSKYKKNGVERMSVWCNIIESNDGNIYTIAYNPKRELLDVGKLKHFIFVRPAITLSILRDDTRGYRMKCSVTEFCVMRDADENTRFMAPQ